MEYLLICYPKCSTCQKVKKWLDAREVDYKERHIVTETPTVQELEKWQKLSDLPLKRFFNTSGLVYKDLNLKEKLAQMPEKEQLSLLADNGMLIKRPLLIADKKVLVGFKEAEWEALVPEKEG